MKNIFISLCLFCTLCNVSAQLITARERQVMRLEKNFQEAAKFPDYVEERPDEIYYNNMILLFRRCPLSIRPGYSRLFVEEKGDKALVETSCDDEREYKLRWIVRNDSLFIRDIYIGKHCEYFKILPEDADRSILEKFTGGRFVNGLLFVDWITGDLRVISRYPQDDFDLMGGALSQRYDDRKYGSIITVHNGLIVDFKEDLANNPFGQSNIVQRERDYEIAKWSQPFYVDSEPDSLYHNGARYFFRRSPLSLKQGYTDVFHEVEVSIFNRMGAGGFLGAKGYHLTWVTRNDSLFISQIYPTYYDPMRPTLCRETIMARMEEFTGGRLINGLLFVNWISGEFGVITKHLISRNPWELYDRLRSTNRVTKYSDDRENGGYLYIVNGVIRRLIEDDRRPIKN